MFRNKTKQGSKPKEILLLLVCWKVLCFQHFLKWECILLNSAGRGKCTTWKPSKPLWDNLSAWDPQGCCPNSLLWEAVHFISKDASLEARIIQSSVVINHWLAWTQKKDLLSKFTPLEWALKPPWWELQAFWAPSLALWKHQGVFLHLWCRNAGFFLWRRAQSWKRAHREYQPRAGAQSRSHGGMKISSALILLDLLILLKSYSFHSWTLWGNWG